MENPIEAFEHLPKNKKLIVVGGAITLGGILVYMAHKKSQAAADVADTTQTDGTSASGTQDGGSTSADQYANDEGIAPYQDDGDPYGSYYGSGGGGIGSSGGGFGAPTTGAGDIGGSTLTLPDDFGADIGAGIAAGLGAEGITGGGAPVTDPTKHMASKTPIRKNPASSPKKTTKKTATPTKTTEHKTTAPKSTKTTKAKPKAKPKPKKKTTGARLTFR